MAEPPPIRARRRRADGDLPGLGPVSLLDAAAPVSPGTVAEAKRIGNDATPHGVAEDNEEADTERPTENAAGTHRASATTPTGVDAPPAADARAATQPPADATDRPARDAATAQRRHRLAVSGNPYAGTRSRQFNVRLLDPLKERYERLRRELGDQGIDTSVTEMLHALMHEGPESADEARALLQRWRLLNATL
jgi:hypothetical protein